MIRPRTALVVASIALFGLTGCKKLKATQEDSEATPAVALAIDKATASVGEPVAVRFGRSLTPPSGQQYWLSLAPTGSPDSEWGEWHYVASGASADKLTPNTAGSFEVRLHDLYPRHGHGVIGRAKLTVSGEAAAAPPTFKLARTELKAGQPIDVTFDQAVVTPSGQRYWITLAPAGSPDSEWGTWHYVAASATTDKLATGAAGSFEVRLHDLHPQKAHGVLQREAVVVK
jgi:hypothetical protein